MIQQNKCKIYWHFSEPLQIKLKLWHTVFALQVLFCFYLSLWICSLDKLKPEKELEKAKSRILHYKLKIRALFQSLDQSLAMGKLPESLFDAQGEIDSEDVGTK